MNQSAKDLTGFGTPALGCSGNPFHRMAGLVEKLNGKATPPKISNVVLAEKDVRLPKRMAFSLSSNGLATGLSRDELLKLQDPRESEQLAGLLVRVRRTELMAHLNPSFQIMVGEKSVVVHLPKEQVVGDAIAGREQVKLRQEERFVPLEGSAVPQGSRLFLYLPNANVGESNPMRMGMDALLGKH